MVKSTSQSNIDFDPIHFENEGWLSLESVSHPRLQYTEPTLFIHDGVNSHTFSMIDKYINRSWIHPIESIRFLSGQVCLVIGLHIPIYEQRFHSKPLSQLKGLTYIKGLGVGVLSNYNQLHPGCNQAWGERTQLMFWIAINSGFSKVRGKGRACFGIWV